MIHGGATEGIGRRLSAPLPDYSLLITPGPQDF
jgi:hypothetical protein